MTFYGIDPGVNGGIACLTCVEPRNKVVTVELWSFHNQTLQEIVGLFYRLFDTATPDEIMVVLERVHAMPSKFRGCSTSWTLAENYMMIKTLLTVHRIPWEVTLPERWQTTMGVKIPKSDKKVNKKKINREKAQALFPKVFGITLETADALLLAEFARRTHK